MTTAPVVEPTRAGSGTDLNHLYCCDPEVALCGTDLSDVPETEDETDCAVCVDLEPTPCPACGN